MTIFDPATHRQAGTFIAIFMASIGMMMAMRAMMMAMRAPKLQKARVAERARWREKYKHSPEANLLRLND